MPAPNSAGPHVVCIGEVLWDRFPDTALLGGAPANAAVHAAALGAQSALVNRVGRDEFGSEALEQLRARGVKTSSFQTDPERETGAALVTVVGGEPSFEIVEDAAWDALEWTDDLGAVAGKADAVCFGTLGQRSEPSRSTIRRFVESSSDSAVRCLDLNLRQHYHSPEVIEASLQLANTLKLNRMELTALAQTFGQKDDEAPRTVEYLCEAFSLQWVALTLGAEGSHVWGDGVDARIQAGTVEVRDSVGAGDAFTAALIVQLLAGKDLVEAATAAGEVGTFVATCDGGMPELPNRFRLFE